MRSVHMWFQGSKMDSDLGITWALSCQHDSALEVEACDQLEPDGTDLDLRIISQGPVFHV